MNDILQAIMRDLPLMPSEVVNQWLFPFAEKLGWPPSMREGSRWRYILMLEGVHYWNRFVWELESRTLYLDQLSQKTQNRIWGMAEAHFKNDSNPLNPFRCMTDSKERIASISSYLKRNGRLPLPPVAIEVRGELEIVDGNHRILSLFLYRKLYEKLTDENRINLSLPFDKHAIWVGKQPS